MTALAGRRRRATLVVGIATVAVVAVASVLTVLGAVTLYNSTEGATPAPDEPDLTFPDTPTGAIAALDDEGRLASIAVLVVQPASRGGSIVAVPVNADASGGVGTERLPLAETVALQGPDVLAQELEVALRLQLDQVEVVDADRLAELLEPVGDIAVDLPTDVTDADGATVAEAGASTIDAELAAAILTARDPDVPAARQYRAAAAVWSGVAAAVGDGLVADDAATTDDVPAVDDLDDLFDRLVGGRVGYRSLRSAEPDDADNARGVDVVTLDPGGAHARVRPDRPVRRGGAERRAHVPRREPRSATSSSRPPAGPTPTSPSAPSPPCSSSAPTCSRCPRRVTRRGSAPGSRSPTRRSCRAPRRPTCCSVRSTSRSPSGRSPASTPC